jgi:hypothetical protein
MKKSGILLSLTVRVLDAFSALLATPETQMRIQHVLKGGK